MPASPMQYSRMRFGFYRFSVFGACTPTEYNEAFWEMGLYSRNWKARFTPIGPLFTADDQENKLYTQNWAFQKINKTATSFFGFEVRGECYLMHSEESFYEHLLRIRNYDWYGLTLAMQLDVKLINSQFFSPAQSIELRLPSENKRKSPHRGLLINSVRKRVR